MRSSDMTACRIITLCGICLVAFAAIAGGQGYRPSTTTIVGATSTTLQLQQLYKNSQKWKIDYRLRPKAACSGRSRNNLCAAAATESVDAYFQLVMATSPRIYSTTNSSQAGAANLVAPPGDQQTCQTCSAFAVGAAAETAMASVLRVNAQDCSISVQSLYFCPSDRPAPSCGAGWDLPSVLAQLQDRGQEIPTASCLPYKPDYKGELSKSETCSGICEDPNKYAAQGKFSSVKITTIWEAQRHIRHYGSVVTRFDVFSDFRSFFEDKRNAKAVYSPNATASYKFGHAVVLVGYDNEKQFWLAKNSWGFEWGDGGFFRVAYGVCSVLTLDTGEAYGVTWTPTVKPSSIKLPVTPAKNSTTCFEYKARPGDYLSKIAWLTGIPLDKFMLDNVATVKDVDVLIPGTKLLLCNPQRDSILPPADPAQPDLQLEALLRVKSHIDKTGVLQQWSKASGADKGYCVWRGVECTPESNVKWINVWAGQGIEGLQGTLPPASAFKGLDTLSQMAYSDQSGITGTIPDWSSLVGLTRIELANNSLTGAIPTSLAKLANLSELWLADNKLSGTLPSELQNVASLTQLDLTNNRFSGPIPGWLGKLTNLEILKFGGNRFTGLVPASLGELPNLNTLYLWNNKQLFGCIPANLQKQLVDKGRDFKTNVLGGTQITGYCINGSTSNLPPTGQGLYTPVNMSLELDSLLKFKATLDPDNVLQGWNKEAGLDGGYCAWRGITCRSNELMVERIMITKGNGIEGLKGKLPPASTFAGLTSLVEIGISNQPGIIGTIPDWSSLKRLQSVQLAKTSLGGSIPASFGALPQLKILYLWQNKLVGGLPDSLQRLLVLEYIDMSGNELSGTLPMWLGKLPKLRYLDLNDNKFTGTVPASLAESKSLQVIYLNGNKELGGCLPLSLKEQIKLSPQEFQNGILSDTKIVGYCATTNKSANGTLRNATLVGGSIGTVDPDPQLESLLQIKAALDKDNTVLPGWNRPAGVDGGYCDWVGIECVPGTKKVRQINIWSGTNIQGLRGTLPGYKAFAGLTNLTDLGISDQPLITGRIPEDWAKLKQLEAVRIGNNSLSGTIPSSWKGLKKLNDMQLYDNNLVGGIPAWFGDLPLINILRVENNNLGGQLPPNFSKLRSLKLLLVSGNELTGTLPAYLGNFTSLVLLGLHRNNFTGSIPASFSQLRNLKVLGLASNQLSGTIPASMASLKVLEKLYLWGNPQLGGCMPISWRGQLTIDVKLELLHGTQLKGFC